MLERASHTRVISHVRPYYIASVASWAAASEPQAKIRTQSPDCRWRMGPSCPAVVWACARSKSRSRRGPTPANFVRCPRLLPVGPLCANMNSIAQSAASDHSTPSPVLHGSVADPCRVADSRRFGCRHCAGQCAPTGSSCHCGDQAANRRHERRRRDLLWPQPGVGRAARGGGAPAGVGCGHVNQSRMLERVFGGK